MRSRSSANIRRKVTWGSKSVLPSILLLALIFVAPRPIHAQGEPTTGAPLTPAERKLDRELRAKAPESTGETDVIVEFTDGGDDADVIYGFGRKGPRLEGMNGRVLRVPNGLLTPAG
jgi:hypothetical protein